jgi:nucleoside-diphosphate-sugar epimerase
MNISSQNTALVVGSTGIVGANLANELHSSGWSSYGLARNPIASPGLKPIAVDLQNADSVTTALKGLSVSHVFITAWLRQPTERQNIEVNGSMVRNVLNALSAAKSVQHVALVTGLKHYLGPFEAYGKGVLPATPFREEQERLAIENFYYAQEDEVFAAAKRDGFSWSVHRPHTIIGYALGNAMNMGVTLAVYASLCKELGLPFVFPGSAAQWNGLTDMTDARVLAKHLLWASTSKAGDNQAFNIVNGDVFRWSWMWPRLASWFGIQAAEFKGEGVPLERQFQDIGKHWKGLVQKYQLQENDFDKIVSAWHTDADLGRPIEVVADMSKSRKLGFLDYQATDESFFSLFERLRAAKIIP